MNITGADVVREVRKLAEANPDFRYMIPDGEPQCLYVHADGQGGCIVGQALIALGVGPEELHEHEYRGAAEVINVHLGIPATDGELEWVAAVQNHQDNYDTWGVAVSRADGA